MVVRTDAKQPWHCRLVVNGRTLLSSENYSRMVGAERCILAAARHFDVGAVGLRWNVEGVEKVFITKAGYYLAAMPTVLYVDERTSRA